MSSTFLSANDLSRLDREQELLEQAPRQPIEDDRTPDDPMGVSLRDLIMQGVMEQLERRLQ